MFVKGIAIVIGLAALVILVRAANKRSCMKAYAKGFLDLGERTWTEIEDCYHAYLKPPMSPMDAAAYQRGIEYRLSSTAVRDRREIKADFRSAWRAAVFTEEGTRLRRMSATARSELNFEPRIDASILDRLRRNPARLPMLVLIPSSE